MKRRTLRNSLFAALLMSTFAASAQSDSKTVNLSVVLANACSITFASGAAGQDAALNYTTPNDYLNGVTLTQASAFTATSTQAYTVKVRATGDLVFSGTAGANTADIPVADITVNASASGSPSGVTFEAATALSSSADVLLISSTGGTTSQVYGLTYTTAGANTAHFLNKATGTYATTLTYTITAP